MAGTEADPSFVRQESTCSQVFCKEQGVFAGALLADQPSYCTSPPIEVVVFGWGVTEDGQLGLDSNEDVGRPSVMESLLGTSFSGFRYNRKPIVAGSRHTLAILEDGRILAWGWNDRGSLGLGHRNTTPKPTVVRGLEHEHIVQVAAGGWHCLAVTKSGSIYAWGGNEYFQCGVDAGKRDLTVPKPTIPFLKVSMVSCGGMHSVALTTTGEVWQWGEPWGDFSIEVNRSPRKLAATKIVSITSGAFHNLALNSCNQVLAWGTNDFGQLGTGDTTYATEPRFSVGLEHIHVADISAGGWHSLVLSADGEVYTWGRGEYGRLGLNDPKGVSRVRPCLVPGLTGHRVIQAMCGGSHTMALTDQGHIFTWGRCTNGRQGFDAQATVQLPAQIHMPGGSERWHPICIAAGGRHSMCMALPRQTVTDHARRLTAQSESSSWIGRMSDMLIPPAAPVLVKAPSLDDKRSNSQGMFGKFLSRSATGQAASSVPNQAPQGGDQHMVYTVPADRQAFMRESTTTDCGQSETIGSSTSGHGVSAPSGASSMGQDAPPASHMIHAEATLHHHSEAVEPRGASFDDLGRGQIEPQEPEQILSPETDIEFPCGPHADEGGAGSNTPRLGHRHTQDSDDCSINLAQESSHVQSSHVDMDGHGGVFVEHAEATPGTQSSEMDDEHYSQHLAEDNEARSQE